jgi:hypothetical protein
MTALSEVLKIPMGMKEGFNPVLVEEIQITWIYFSLLLTKVW